MWIENIMGIIKLGTTDNRSERKIASFFVVVYRKAGVFFWAWHKLGGFRPVCHTIKFGVYIFGESITFLFFMLTNFLKKYLKKIVSKTYMRVNKIFIESKRNLIWWIFENCQERPKKCSTVYKMADLFNHCFIIFFRNIALYMYNTLLIESCFKWAKVKTFFRGSNVYYKMNYSMHFR